MSRQSVLSLILTLILLGLGQLGYLTPLRVAIQTALVPLQESISSTAQDLLGQSNLSKNIVTLQSRVSELETTNEKLLIENVQLREMARENEQLHQLLNYTRSNPQFNYQGAEVKGRIIGIDPTNFLYYVYIDVGARDGIAKHMPVVTHRGLVGRVTEVGPNYARVLMLIDPASAVNAVVQNSRATGTVRGTIDTSLIMDRIPQNEQVSPGDIVLTSGLGGNFPSKLVIGQVTEVIQRDQDLFQTARIRPTVDFGKLETVLVITAFEPVDIESEILQQQEK